ncbi:DUF6515 family protein [Desulfococcaceae bacterium HSG7]|nr:DUF6515 family protein [Desulfococcaceae bacterium HSG7]
MCFKLRLLIFVCIGLFLTSLIGIKDETLASPKRGPGIVHRSYPHGKMVAKLPIRHRSVRVSGAGYFFHSGIFYQRRNSGFIVVRPPIGAILVNIPVGFATITIGGHLYYHYLGVYYQKIPDGYMVIEPPREAAVISEPVQTACEAGTPVAVTAGVLNVRSGPGKHFSVIHQVYKGDIIYVHDTAPEWKYICTPYAKYGWIMKEFIGPSSPSASG